MRKSLLAILALSIAITTMEMSAIAKPYFPMTCQTGGKMHLVLSPDFRRKRTRLSIWFKKARAAAKVQRPPPGKCAWLDRPLNAHEPSVVWVFLKAEIWTEFSARGTTRRVKTGVVSGRDEDLARTFLDTIRGTGCFVLSVRNSDRGYLEAQLQIERGC